MKIAFISDIHGNAIALDAVLENLKRNLVDKVCVLGDLCYRGPEPKRSLDLIRSLDTDVIKGNADEWVVRGVREGEVPGKALELMNEERNWTVTRLDQEDLDYLQSLPTELKFEHGGISIYAYHATPESLFEVVLPDAADSDLEAKLMQKESSQLYVYAHIHKPYIRYINGKIIMNIGSVGLPFDGVAKASYGLVEIEDGNIRTSIQRVSFNQEKVVELYHHENYPNAEMMSGVIRNGKL